MGRLRESHAMKITMVILLLIFILLIPVCVFAEERLYYDILEKNLISNAGYENTSEFIDLYNQKIAQLAEYLKLKRILETGGKLDYDKTAITITGAENGEKEVYTIGDLIKKSSFFVEDVTPVDDNTLEDIFKDTFGYYLIYGENNIVDGIDWYSSKDFVQDFSNVDHAIIVEDLNIAQEYYETQWFPEQVSQEAEQMEGDAAEDMAESLQVLEASEELQMNSSKMVDGNVVHIVPPRSRDKKTGLKVYLIDEIAYCYTYYVSFYLYYQNLFSTGNSNFIYWLATDSNMFATNLGEEAMGKELYQSFYSPVMGELHYETNEYTIITKLPYVERRYIEDIEECLAKNGENVRIHMGVLSEMPVEDAFSAGKHLYNLAQDLVVFFLVLGIISIIGIMTCSIFLILSAGCSREQEGITLTKFDYLYTEIGLGFCIAIGVISVYIVNDKVWNGNLNRITTNILLGIEALFLYFLFIFSMASFIRRIKVHTIWKNSLLLNGAKFLKRICRKIGKGIRQVYDRRKVTTKIIIIFVTAIIGLAGLEAVIIFNHGIWKLLFSGCYLFLIISILLWLLRGGIQNAKLVEGAERIADGDLNYKISVNDFKGSNERLAKAINRICDGLSMAVEQSIKDERMKTDLITNVSHDIKTPLTSIINYVNLLKREPIQDEKILSYIEVLDSKSQRLKNLTDDLVEASKLSSGNVVLTIEKIDLVELVNQTNGEFSEKFDAKNLVIVSSLPEKSVFVEADGRRLWRVLENLYNNVAKYAMENTRVYVTVEQVEGYVSFVMKNISASPLNINSEELTERFIRGDVSRSTEGSGLGLSIAKTLTELMQGKFQIYLDGDLFRVTLTFPIKQEIEEKQEIYVEET